MNIRHTYYQGFFYAVKIVGYWLLFGCGLFTALVALSIVGVIETAYPGWTLALLVPATALSYLVTRIDPKRCADSLSSIEG